MMTVIKFIMDKLMTVNGEYIANSADHYDIALVSGVGTRQEHHINSADCIVFRGERRGEHSDHL